MNTILIIEDNVNMRENIAEILELANYKVYTAENGRVGIRIAETVQPQLIVCDIMMPGINGFAVYHVLSNQPQTANIPFIFLSAKSDIKDIRKGMALGADDYLTKPFDEMDLLNSIETRLKKKNAIKAQNSTPRIIPFQDELSLKRAQTKIFNLFKNKKCRVYKRKELVFSEGDFVSGVYFVKSGRIRSYQTNVDNKELTMNLYKEGDLLGYSCLLSQKEFNISAITLEKSEVYKVYKEEFIKLISSDIDVSLYFIGKLSSNIIQKDECMLNLAYNSVRKRVAIGLIQYAQKYGKLEEDALKIYISRDDLASMVGTSTESAIRVLSDFKSEKIISIKASQINILNSERLVNMLN